jgi:hypothetical protein
MTPAPHNGSDKKSMSPDRRPVAEKDASSELLLIHDNEPRLGEPRGSIQTVEKSSGNISKTA